MFPPLGFIRGKNVVDCAAVVEAMQGRTARAGYDAIVFRRWEAVARFTAEIPTSDFMAEMTRRRDASVATW